MVKKMSRDLQNKKKEQRTKLEVIIGTLKYQGTIPLISFHLKKAIRTKRQQEANKDA